MWDWRCFTSGKHLVDEYVQNSWEELIETKNFFNKLSSDHLKNLLGVHEPSKNCDSIGASISHACMSMNKAMFVKPMNADGG